MPAKVIVLTNQKGGCGKTTISIHLATGLVRKGYRVLVIDADPQHTAQNWSLNKNSFQFETLILENNQTVNRVVFNQLEKYDYLIIDCPPSVESSITYSALLVSNLAIVPLLCSANDLWALQKIVELIKQAKKTNPSLQERLLINQYKAKENLSRGILKAIEDLHLPMLSTKLGSRVAFKESSAYGLTVYELKDSKAIEEVEQITQEIIKLTKEYEK
jgi:chromosome partitioning protein